MKRGIRKSIALGVSMLAMGLLAVGAIAQDAFLKQKRGGVDLYETDIRQAIRILFDQSGVSYAVDPAVKGKVTAKFTDSTNEEILKGLLSQVHASYRIENKVFVIFTKPDELPVSTEAQRPIEVAKDNSLPPASFQGLANLPESMDPNDLTSDYHAIKVKVNGAPGLLDSFGLMFGGLMQSMGSMGAGSSPENAPPAWLGMIDVTWTKDQMVSVFGTDFLVTYGLDNNLMELATLAQKSETKPKLKLILVKPSSINQLMPMTGLTKETFVKALESMKQQKPAETATAMAPTEVPSAGAAELPAHADAAIDDSAQRTQSLSNAKQMATALMIYAADYDDVLPYAQGTKGVQKAIYPYCKNRAVFSSTNPRGAGEFRFNMALAGVSPPDVEAPAEVPILWDPTPWAGGQMLVAFCDGHAKMLNEKEWKAAQKWMKPRWKRTGKPLPMNYGKEGGG